MDHAARSILGATAVCLGASIAACHAVSPPPIMPMHAGTAPREVDATTVTVMLGAAGELFGGDGWGVAVRGERQVDDGTAVGVQLGGGRGSEGETRDGKPLRHWLLEARGYGRLMSLDRDWLAGVASVGVTTMDTGLVAGTLGVGASVSYPNQYAVPAFGLFGAVSQPLRRGRAFGPDADKLVHTTWWLGLMGGVQVPVGDSGNVPSIEAGVAFGAGHTDSMQMSLSVADSHSF